MAADENAQGAKDAADPADDRLRRLRAIIEKHSLLRGDFVLSSGRKSTFLFQLRQTVLHPEGASLIGALIVEFMKAHGLKCIGGLEMGAVPIVTAVAQASHHMDYPIGAFFVRKAQKAHGARERIDGYIEGYREVLLVDDVTTTGGSTLQAIDAIRSEGHDIAVTKALSVLDRQEGAAENFAARGIELFALVKKSDFNL